MNRTAVLIAALAWSVLASGYLSAQNVRPSPVYTGDGLPAGPQQHAAWPHPTTKLPQTLIDDVDLLFAQGVADPRGGEYRQIEVVVGNCWRGDGGVVKTHGWCLPLPAGRKQQFAVCWNGLIYPVVSAGGKADLGADVAALCHEGKALGFGATPEATAVAFDSRLPLKVCMLLRLGDADLAERLYAAVAPAAEQDVAGHKQPNDPYLNLSREWCWYAFDRAVCAHMWGNDVVSRDTAKLLSDALPQIEANGKKLGFTHPSPIDPHNFNHEIPNAPYVSFVVQLPALLTDEQRRVSEGAVQRVLDHPEAYRNNKARIAALIRDLEIDSARQSGQPGGVGLDDDPVAEALVKEGSDAVEPLIDCLQKDDRLTRAVSFGRDFFMSRNLLPVRGAAYAVLQRILQTETFGPVSDSMNRGGGGDTKAIVAEIRAFWAKSKGKSLARRWYDTLKDDNAGPTRWVEAAGHIVEPADVHRVGEWISEPTRKPGQVPPMKGEELRAQKSPSVAELMARRVPAVAAENDGWLFAQTNAADLALDLFKWDPASAKPVLREQMQRCMDASDADAKQINPDPHWEQSTQTTEQMARDVGRLTTALAELHDAQGLQSYQKWVVGQTPASPGNNVGALIRPIWRFPDDLTLSAAAEELFNGPKSSWRCLPNVPQFRDWGPTSLMKSAIWGVPAFRKHAVRNLGDLTQIGSAEIKDHELSITMNDGAGEGYGIENTADPLLPKPGSGKVAIRVCDWYAEAISELDGAPPYEIYWPVAKRDEQRPKLVAFLQRWGDRFRYTPLQDTLDFGFHNQDSGRMTFPRLNRPATDADVAATAAIFALHGGPVRVVSMPAWPAKAEWTTFKDYPIQRQGETDMKTGVTKYTADYLNEGMVWQAEEIQIKGQWVRYYGFVGPHIIAKVPADQIEFIKDP
ncbi:MAG TPA: hypothetical protein VHY37_02150 [Tepidisphaeraceae bacterium]|nr:hypothetical protein [Tepidisphaeraceae bacterium]